MGWPKDEFIRTSYTTEGDISCGAKIMTAKGEQLVKYDYFNVSKFPEIMNIYGDKPKEIFIEFPNFGDVEEFASYAFYDYNQKRLKRICDRDIFTAISDFKDYIDGKPIEYHRGEKHKCIFPDCKGKCKAGIRITARVVNNEEQQIYLLPGFVSFVNHNYKSGNRIVTQLKDIINKFGKAAITAFIWKIKVIMVQGKYDKDPTFSLEIAGPRRAPLAQQLLAESGIDNIQVKNKKAEKGKEPQASIYDNVKDAEFEEIVPEETSEGIINDDLPFQDAGMGSSKGKFDKLNHMPPSVSAAQADPNRKEPGDTPKASSGDIPVLNEYMVLKKRAESCETKDEWRNILQALNNSRELSPVEKKGINEILQQIKDIVK